ncbi:MAG: hypothetical protein KC983_08420 [Phycisphaerales bacterium]|nr:hypothetical protein [Phycisphaerales bacterium]
MKIETLAPGWTPGIGDPTITGWLSVVGYYLIALLCVAIVHAIRRTGSRRQVAAWMMLAGTFMLLGLIKQFDLLSAVTAFLRDQAKRTGHYADRHEWSGMVMLGIAIIVAGGLAWSMHRLRPRTRAQRGIALGTSMLILFIVTRSASIHTIDHLLRATIGSLRLNAWIEFSLLFTIAAGAVYTWRRPGLHADRQSRAPGQYR